MAATVQVNVDVLDQVAIQKLADLDATINKLNSKSVNINVNVGGGNGSGGSGGSGSAGKALQEIGVVAEKAGYSLEDLGDKAKSVEKIVDGETQKVTETFKQGVKQTVQVSTDGTVKVTQNYEAEAKAAEKAAEAEAKAAAKAAEAETKAADSRVATWGRVIKAASAALIIKNTREALKAMKEVDSELANIKKVTGESTEVIETLGEKAYDVASEYGVSAKEYLQSAAEFAKAGYSNYADLAELAIQTQLVGDVSADTAYKFLLSADAAFKFGGNVEKLSSVLDEANEIENNYATSIEKVADGLPIVASTAAMANMSMEETMAALGTITSVTQESGRKAATALRALILNITGEVGTVIDEDLKITQESVNSMADALSKYGSEAIKAAQATGDLIDPMEAIRSLSEAYKNGDLSRSELFSILTDVGGKLRTNQLVALVENFDMFQQMLGRVETSSGSAEKEVDVMLDTWTAKTNILKNTWTDFVSSVLDSSTIKSGIDAVTGLIKGLSDAISTTAGSAMFKFTALTLGISKTVSIVGTLLKTTFAQNAISAIQSVITALGTGGLTGALTQVGTLLASSPVAWAAMAAAAIVAIDLLANNAENKYQKAVENVNSLVQEYNNLYGENGIYASELNHLLANYDALDEREQTRLATLQAQEDSLRNQVKLARQEEFEAWQKLKGTGPSYWAPLYENGELVGENVITHSMERLASLKNKYNEVIEDGNQKYEEGTWSLEEYNRALADVVSAHSDYYNELKSWQESGFEITDEAQLEFMRLYEEASKRYVESKHEETVAAKAAAEAASNQAKSEAELSVAQSTAAKDLGVLKEAVDDGVKSYEDFDSVMDKVYSKEKQAYIQGLMQAAGAGLELPEYLQADIDLYSVLADAMESAGEEGADYAQIMQDLYDTWTDYIEQGGNVEDASYGVTEANEEASESFNRLARDAKSAEEALENYQKRASGNKGANAEGYSSAYKQFYNDWTSGKTDTNAVNAAFGLFFTEQMRRDMGYDMEAMGEVLASDLYQGIFNGASGDAGVDFAQYIREHMTEGLAEIAKITENGDGTFNFEYASAQALADYFKLPLPAIQALLSALDVYGVEVEMGWEDTQKLAESLGLVGENSDGAGKSIQDIAKGLYDLGYTDPTKIASILKTLGEKGFIEGLESMDPAEIGQAIAIALGLIEPPEIESEVTVDGDQVGEAVEGATEGASPEVTVKTTVSDEGAGETVDKIEDAEDKTVTLTAAGEDDGFEELKEDYDGVDSKNETLTFTGEDNGLTALASVWHGINSKVVTLTVNVQQNGSLPPYAEGTKNAPGGIALVNEKGPELISDNGRAYIANGGKPAIVSLGKGAIVLTAEETRRALGSITVNNGIPAYASGIPISVAKKTSSGSGGGGGSKTKKEKSSSKESNPWEELEKELKEDLSDFDEIAEWYHNQKLHDEEVQTYQEAIARINEARDKYREAGYEESSAEMAKLANEIFDYEEDIRKAYSHAIDDLEDEIDLIDEQIELAENQGDLEKSLQLQKLAQEKIAQLIETYREAGYEDTSEQILKLANKGYDYTSDTDSTMKKLWSNLIDALKDMQETQDDANTLAEKQLAVEEAQDALQKAQKQRTVRVFNPVTGQWEWIADAKSIADAEEKLANAEKNLLKEQQSQELDSLRKLADSNGNLSDFTIGPGLAAMLGGANAEQMAAFATALGVLTGGGRITADTTSRSVFDSIDSHNSNVTQYIFNGTTIDASTAENTTLADLVRMISPLAITNNMPA